MPADEAAFRGARQPGSDAVVQKESPTEFRQAAAALLGLDRGRDRCEMPLDRL
jgi:hypothetical protein